MALSISPRLVLSRQHFIEGALGGLVPVPSIVEGFDLRLRCLAARRFEQHVVVWRSN